MIIDLILDRKDGYEYNPFAFYKSCEAYEKTFNFEFSIVKAMNSGKESKVKSVLCEYIFSQDYNPEICEYIIAVDWLTFDKQ